VSLALILSIYAAIVATYYLYTRVEHLYRHRLYEKTIKADKENLPPIEEVLGGVTLPYEVEEQVTDVPDSDEREWEAEQRFKNKRGR